MIRAAATLWHAWATTIWILTRPSTIGSCSIAGARREGSVPTACSTWQCTRSTAPSSSRTWAMMCQCSRGGCWTRSSPPRCARASGGSCRICKPATPMAALFASPGFPSRRTARRRMFIPQAWRSMTVHFPAAPTTATGHATPMAFTTRPVPGKRRSSRWILIRRVALGLLPQPTSAPRKAVTLTASAASLLPPPASRLPTARINYSSASCARCRLTSWPPRNAGEYSSPPPDSPELSLQINGSQGVLRIAGETGFTCLVQETGLLNGSWTVRATVPMTQPVEEVTLPAPAGTNRFWRVKVQ